MCVCRGFVLGGQRSERPRLIAFGCVRMRLVSGWGLDSCVRHDPGESPLWSGTDVDLHMCGSQASVEISGWFCGRCIFNKGLKRCRAQSRPQQTRRTKAEEGKEGRWQAETDLRPDWTGLWVGLWQDFKGFQTESKRSGEREKLIRGFISCSVSSASLFVCLHTCLLM